MKKPKKSAETAVSAPSVPLPKMWPLAKIKPYPHNPRTHPPAQIKLLADLIRKFGPDQPIVVDEVGVILKGHGRRLAAEAAGLKTFPVVQRGGLSDADKAALRIADNQVALLSGWDTELVRYEMQTLQRMDYDLSLLGFGEAQLVQFTTQPGPPAGGFATFGEDIPTEFCCPRCNYSWSGRPLAGGKGGDGADDDSMRVRMRDNDGRARQQRTSKKVSAEPPLARKKPSGKTKSGEQLS